MNNPLSRPQSLLMLNANSFQGGASHGLPMLAGAILLSACGASSQWEPESGKQYDPPVESVVISELGATSELASSGARHRSTHVIGGSGPSRDERVARGKLTGRVLGTFRNTYYNFPSELEFEGDPVPLMNASCQTIKAVRRGFHDAVCVQGSGHLSEGQTVSFSRRDCECAAECPRTGQKICFDSLDPASYPWGRGATGGPITPMVTIAVDSDVIPLHTVVYIPDYDGLPRDGAGKTVHDGCFIAQDRGLRVKGRHVDVFTGDTGMTKMYNHLVPSNQGVTVVLDSPRCERKTIRQ